MARNSACLTYPFVYIIKNIGLAGAAATTYEQVGYSCADVIAKAVFGVLIWAMSSPPTIAETEAAIVRARTIAEAEAHDRARISYWIRFDDEMYWHRPHDDMTEEEEAFWEEMFERDLDEQEDGQEGKGVGKAKGKDKGKDKNLLWQRRGKDKGKDKAKGKGKDSAKGKRRSKGMGWAAREISRRDR